MTKEELVKLYQEEYKHFLVDGDFLVADYDTYNDAKPLAHAYALTKVYAAGGSRVDD